MIEIAIKLAFWLFEMFYKNDKDKTEAKKRFLKFVKAHKQFGQRGVRLHERYGNLLKEIAKDENKSENASANSGNKS